ncbi:MAG: hypothetical protein ACOX2G_06895 [Bacillota bacterium]|jgi:hypothetical protein
MQKLTIIAICLLILFVPGCIIESNNDSENGSNNGDQTNEGEEIPEDEDPSTEKILECLNLEDLGVKVDIDKLQSFIDPNRNVPYPSDYMVSTNSEIPNTSILSFEYCIERLSLEYMDALYLTGTFKPSDPEPEYSIKIGADINCSLVDLKEFTVYEDEKILIFDVTDLIGVEKFADKIASLPTTHGTFEWMLDVYNYLRTYKDFSVIYFDNENGSHNGDQVNEGGEIPGEDNPSPEKILECLNLEDLGVKVDIDKLQSFIDPNRNVPYPSDYMVSTNSEIPNTSILSFEYCIERLSLEYMDALYLTGTFKPSDPEPEYSIKIGADINCSLVDLKEFTVYEDEKILIFDVTDLIGVEKFADKIASLPTTHGTFEWMLDVYNYLRTYKDFSIIYK